MKERQIKANGLEFSYIESGAGPLALCLHGFPDSPHSYRHLMPALVDAGYRAVAPYIRGYAPTSVPEDGDYSTAARAADFNALHQALGGESDAVLIAHDWGSVAAYGVLAAQPERWRCAVMMNIPPLAVLGDYLFQYEQIKRSFYFWFFQMRVSDAIVPLNNFEFLDNLWADWSPGYDASTELKHVKKSLAKSDNLQAAMGYYRHLFDALLFGTPEEMERQAAVWGNPVSQPALYLHGSNDGCIMLDDAGLKDILNYLGTGSEVEWVEDVGHFMMLENPDLLNRRILEFLNKSPIR